LGWQTHYERVCLTRFEMRGGSGEVGRDPLNPYQGGAFELGKGS
jgi:hypothetical protein